MKKNKKLNENSSIKNELKLIFDCLLSTLLFSSLIITLYFAFNGGVF